MPVDYLDILRHRATGLTQFLNTCHDPDSGEFCSGIEGKHLPHPSQPSNKIYDHAKLRAQSMPVTMKEALAYYGRQGSVDVGFTAILEAALRNPSDPDASTNEILSTIDELDIAFDEFSVPTNGAILYRGYLNTSRTGNSLRTEGITKGNENYTSTSVSEEIAKTKFTGAGGTLVKIHTNPVTKAIYGYKQGEDFEQELILPRKTVIKVVDVVYDKASDIYIVNAEVVE